MSTLRTNILSNVAGTKSVPTDTVADGSAKAWANFNGATTPAALRDSFNASSITDNGTGDYTITYTSAMPTFNYGATMGFTPPDTSAAYLMGGQVGGGGVAVGSFRMQSRYGTGGVAIDVTHGSFAVHSK